MAQVYKYYKSCVLHSGKEVDLLLDMIRNAREITFRTFCRHCDWKNCAIMLNYAIGSERGLHLKDDYHVSFHTSRYNGIRCYYIRHSSIEYIFLPHP